MAFDPNEETPFKAWVLWHKYYDGSGAHIERVYFDKRRADEDYRLVKATEAVGGSGEWMLHEVSLYGPANVAPV